MYGIVSAKTMLEIMILPMMIPWMMIMMIMMVPWMMTSMTPRLKKLLHWAPIQT